MNYRRRQVDPKKEVPSLELCKKLKQLGYPQEKNAFFDFYWCKVWGANEYKLFYTLDGSAFHDADCFDDNLFIDRKCNAIHWLDIEDSIKAPVIAELTEYLREYIEVANLLAKMLIDFMKKGRKP